MLARLKSLLGLKPVAGIPVTQLQIQVGVLENKLCMKLSHKVDSITFDRQQLSQFLAAVASRAAEIK